MKWAAVIQYNPDPAKVAEHRPAHRAYLSTLLAADKLVSGGPFLDDSGAIITYEVATKEEAEELIRADPFHAAGVFARWDIRPWKAVFANPRLLPVNG